MHRTEGLNNSSNRFTDGPPATIVESRWLNAVQEEIANVIEGSGASLLYGSTDTEDQLLLAIQTLISNSTGVPVGAIVPVIPGYFTDGINGGYTGIVYTIPDEFQFCDGSAYNDFDSPIYNGAGRFLPNLTDDRFIMGDTAGSVGTTGGANDGHYHGMGAGADLNITASGSHTHTLTYPLAGLTAGGALGNSGATANAAWQSMSSTTHTHTSGNFAGSIGLVTGGFDGNAAGSNIPKRLSAKFYQRVR